MRRQPNSWKQILLIAVVLLGAMGLLFSLTRANESAINAIPAEAAHDHNGDGKPDHAGDGGH
ncbi:MAG: hypothetical protein H7Y38_09255 [Armatimonadetes bacterium]|nr:hypothetical protein [Armatimonadota bacterium]